MKINPTLKIAGATVLTAGGAFEFYNAYKSTGAKRWIHAIAGLGLTATGVTIGIKSYKEIKNASGKSSASGTISEEPQKKSIFKEIADEIRRPIVKEKKSTSDQQDIINPDTDFNANGISNKNASQNRQSPKVVGKMDAHRIAASQHRKMQLQNRINLLRQELSRLPRGYDGHQKSIPIKNEIALLTHQIRLT